jgi:hypothetical protein
LAKEWDEDAEEEEDVLNEAEREERSWMARVAPKDGPALASASAGEGMTRGTAVRLASPTSRAQSLVRELSPAASVQPLAQPQVPGQVGSTRQIHVGEDEIFGSTDDSPLTSLRSSVIGGDGDGDGDGDDDEDGEGDPEDYVEADDDDDVEAAFAGRFTRRESFDDDDDDEDEDMEDV